VLRDRRYAGESGGVTLLLYLLLLMDGKILDSRCGSCFDFLYDSQLEI
jgi:hypothetical protein